MEYNCRIREYNTGCHVTLFDKTVVRGKVNETCKRTNKNEDRTEDQIKHCLAQSMNTSKNKIYNIARSNMWEWFITLTFDREKVTASNYDEVTKRITMFLNNVRKRKCPDLKYLIVPELHKDGINYHFHGLLSDCDGLQFVDSGHKTSDGDVIYNIKDWSLGFSTATKVKDTNRVSGYITKYITKDMIRTLPNKKRYYASRNIKVAEDTFLCVDKEEFLRDCIDDVTFLKTQSIPKAGQRIKYMEVERREEHV